MKKELQKIHEILNIYQINDEDLDILIAIMARLIDNEKWDLLEKFMYYFIDLSSEYIMCSELDECFNHFWILLNTRKEGIV